MRDVWPSVGKFSGLKCQTQGVEVQVLVTKISTLSIESSKEWNCETSLWLAPELKPQP